MTSPSFDHLFKDIEDDIQKLSAKLAPTVIIKGWWWKKYLKKFKAIKKHDDQIDSLVYVYTAIKNKDLYFFERKKDKIIFDHLFQKYILPFYATLFIIASVVVLGSWGYIRFFR
jgi:hypothetical protein